jgi:hypothetical protein
MKNFLCESPTKTITKNIENENDLRTSFSSIYFKEKQLRLSDNFSN